MSDTRNALKARSEQPALSGLLSIRYRFLTDTALHAIALYRIRSKLDSNRLTVLHLSAVDIQQDDMNRDYGLDTLLNLNGVIIEQLHGHWVKFDVSMTDVSQERPHGIRYSLTLHDKYGQRIMGYDNAHAVKSPRRNKYVGRKVEFDHIHRHQNDTGTPYEFSDAYQLIQDFFESVDKMLAK